MGLIRAFSRLAPAGPVTASHIRVLRSSEYGPRPDFQNTVPIRALRMRVPAGPQSAGPSWSFIRRAQCPGSQTAHPSRTFIYAGPIRALRRRAPAAFSYVRSMALRWWAPAGLSCGGLHSGPQMAGPIQALKRSQPGFHTASPILALRRWAPAGPSIGGLRPGFYTAGSGQAYKW